MAVPPIRKAPTAVLPRELLPGLVWLQAVPEWLAPPDLAALQGPLPEWEPGLPVDLAAPV